jgi:formiminotetrahydrofolate cyclodeaminase
VGGLDERPVRDALGALASAATPAAAGVACALAGASAAALVELTAGLAADRVAAEGTGARDREPRLRERAARGSEIRRRLLAAADEDVAAYSEVLSAGDSAARERALERASEPPLRIAELAAEVAEAAAEIAAAGSWAFRADAVVAGELAMAAALGASDLVAANLAARADDPRAARARAAAERARAANRLPDDLPH